MEPLKFEHFTVDTITRDNVRLFGRMVILYFKKPVWVEYATLENVAKEYRKWIVSFLTRELRACARASCRYGVGNDTRSIARSISRFL